jgi:hypothetical protein
VSAKPDRIVLAAIPDVEDLQTRVSIVTWPDHPEFGTQLAIEDYVPSLDEYGRGYFFDPRHRAKVIAALRSAGSAGLEAAARELSS